MPENTARSQRSGTVRGCCNVAAMLAVCPPFCAPVFHVARWYYLEAEKKDNNNGLKDFLKARTVPMRSNIVRARSLRVAVDVVVCRAYPFWLACAWPADRNN